MIKLKSGHSMPQLGLGTWLSKPGEVKAAVKVSEGRAVCEHAYAQVAVDLGYRHIDTAWGYGNQSEIGEALAELFAEGKVRRN
jgi:diketogulonate reductase-like aldo/keto reductase